MHAHSIYQLVFLILLASSPLAQAQNGSVTQRTQERPLNPGLSMPSLVVGGTEAPLNVTGTAYLDTTWQLGTITFYQPLTPISTSDSLPGVLLRIDLATNDAEVKASANDIRLAKGPTIRAIRFADAGTGLYVNVHHYPTLPSPLGGYFEQVAVGPLTLLRHPYLYRKKANYNVAMGTGSSVDELIQKQDWYVVQSGQVQPFSPSRKALLMLMNDKRSELEAYLKREQPDLKSKTGLKAVFTYYNQL